MTGLCVEEALRIFELDLMDAVGFGLQLEYDVNTEQALQPSAYYHFKVEQGPIAALNGRFVGATLQAIKHRDFTNPQVLIEAKILMRTVITVYLQGKPLKSRAVINNIIKYL
jgi:DNA repair protein RecO (recombination protein O)